MLSFILCFFILPVTTESKTYNLMKHGEIYFLFYGLHLKQMLHSTYFPLYNFMNNKSSIRFKVLKKQNIEM